MAHKFEEAWDAISRYICAGLQGGSIMEGCVSDENVMIACCSAGRPAGDLQSLRFKYASDTRRNT